MFVRILAFPMESMRSPVCSNVLRMNEDAPPGSDRLLGRLSPATLTWRAVASAWPLAFAERTLLTRTCELIEEAGVTLPA